jgi:hypothetical protein
MDLWIVEGGNVRPLDIDHLPSRDGYGSEWVVAEAKDEGSALAAAEQYDAGAWAEFGLAAFAAAYRGGTVGLPGDAMGGISEIAKRAGVKPDTVHAWRSRHATFPAPAQTLAMGPLWWWSDVAAWLAVPRKAGRPAQR